MTKKNILFLSFIFAGLSTFHVHAMLNNLFKFNNTLKKVFNRKKLPKAQPSIPSSSFFCGITIDKNEENKRIIGFNDIHVFRDYLITKKLPLYKKKKIFSNIRRLTKLQQQDLLTLIKNLKNKGEEILVLVEDIATAEKTYKKTYKRKKPSAANGHFNLNNLIATYDPQAISPLLRLEKICKKQDIDVVNVEFRHLAALNKIRFNEEKALIKNNTDPRIMEDLSKYYKKDIFNAVFLDASIINTIQASHASTIMVCAGKTHIDSVRKILQEYGDSKFKTDFNSEVFCHPHHMYLATQKQFSEVLKANDLFFEYINEYYKAQK